MFSGFNTFHMSPREINQKNRATMKGILTEFKEYFKEKELDFFVEEPTPTIIFI